MSQLNRAARHGDRPCHRVWQEVASEPAWAGSPARPGSPGAVPLSAGAAGSSDRLQMSSWPVGFRRDSGGPGERVVNVGPQLDAALRAEPAGFAAACSRASGAKVVWAGVVWAGQVEGRRRRLGGLVVWARPAVLRVQQTKVQER
ncbi:hypothetical protein MHAE_08253 [Mycobacterium haemophilum DSM 44634]